MVACMYGMRDVVDVLVSSGANLNLVDTQGQSVIHKIVLAGTVECLQPILNLHPQLDHVDIQDCTPVVYAIRKKSAELLEKLLKAGADYQRVNEKGNGLLHEACTVGFPGALDPLLRRGLSMNTKNNSGNTPLHVATLQGAQDLVSILLRNGADVNILNASNMTPEALAKSGGQKEIATLIAAEAQKRAREWLSVKHH